MALYAANNYVSDYLQGKGFSIERSDYRYDYFTDSDPLRTALIEMPSWYLIMKGNFWFDGYEFDFSDADNSMFLGGI